MFSVSRLGSNLSLPLGQGSCDGSICGEQRRGALGQEARFGTTVSASWIPGGLGPGGCPAGDAAVEVDEAQVVYKLRRALCR